MPLTLAMDENYPDIYSGSVLFLNTRTGATVSLQMPKDVESGVYGIKSVTMDTGASATIIPEKFGKRLGIDRPAAGQKEYYVFSGVGGTSVCFYSPDPVAVLVSDGTEQLEKMIMPFFLILYAPSITAEKRLLAQPEYQPYTEEIIPFISPPYKYSDEYTVEIRSPTEKFPPQERRLKLDVDVGSEMDYILIGRDWQEPFELTFTAKTIIIKSFSPSNACSQNGGITMEETPFLLPVREFPDRGTKWLLESPENVAGLLQILTPELASRLDFSRLQPQNVSFILDSLRKQESDLLFLVPFQGIAGETEREILIYILIEHQSTPVMAMGFRLLFYMTLIWDRQRQEWERAEVPESQWRFRPIVPLLFYTGDQEWDTPLSVTALMDLPQELERFVPHHDTLFLNLNATAPEQLTEREHPFGWIARVLKQEKAPLEALESELKQAIEHLDRLTVHQQRQWLQAIHYILLLIYHRRAPEEHTPLTQIVSQSVQTRQRQEEVSHMERTIAQAFIEEGTERGIKLGLEEGERGQIQNAQFYTLDVLNARFTVPSATLMELNARLQRIKELSVLQRLHLDAVKVASLDDFVKRLDELQV